MKKRANRTTKNIRKYKSANPYSKSIGILVERVGERKGGKTEWEEVNKIIQPDDEMIIQKVLKLQYSKQFFIRFPKEFEEILDLKKDKHVKFTIKIPPVRENKRVEINLEIVE